MFDIIRVARKYPELKSAAGRMEDFGQLIMELRSLCDELELVEFYGRVCQMSGYVQMLQEKNDMESRGRLENVQELASSISAFWRATPMTHLWRASSTMWPCIPTWTDNPTATIA